MCIGDILQGSLNLVFLWRWLIWACILIKKSNIPVQFIQFKNVSSPTSVLNHVCSVAAVSEMSDVDVWTIYMHLHTVVVSVIFHTMSCGLVWKQTVSLKSADSQSGLITARSDALIVIHIWFVLSCDFQKKLVFFLIIFCETIWLNTHENLSSMPQWGLPLEFLVSLGITRSWQSPGLCRVPSVCTVPAGYL